VSRVYGNVQKQVEDHQAFQNEVSTQRETMLSLEKKGSHLKHFAQKQDVILIKNLLTSVQTRWEKIVSKTAERTKALDHGLKEAKDFHDNWESLCLWLDSAADKLKDATVQNKNDISKIKMEIEKVKEFKKELNGKQPQYDSTMKSGKHLADKSSKADEPVIKNMMTELKNKWINVQDLALEKEKKLEEALLFSGQFKDAIKSLMDWLNKMINNFDDKTPVFGDLDTVMSLVDKHKNFEGELRARSDQVESLKSTVAEMLASADKDDAAKINAQMTEMTTSWDKVWKMTNNKTSRLEEALKEAEKLHKSVNMLLEWLSDAEMKLRFSGPLPEDEDEIKRQIAEHAKFMAEVKEKEKDKDYTLKLANDILAKCHPDAVPIIKQWITMIQSRWEEVASWALQRSDKLNDHLKELKDILVSI
jgi:myosin heavy subunit